MGCKQDSNLPNVLPLATDSRFFKFRQTWLNLKQQNEKKPYDPEAETRYFMKSQEAFYRSGCSLIVVSGQSQYLNKTMYQSSYSGTHQGSPCYI